MLDKHSKNRPEHKCNLCHKGFNSRSGVQKHISTIHKGIRYKCALCPGKFTKKDKLAKHEMNVHKKGGPPTQQCTICGIHLVSSKKSLKIHMGMMHKDASVASACAEKMKMKRKPETNESNVFQCLHCSASFLELNDLQCHLSQSHGIISGTDAEK